MYRTLFDRALAKEKGKEALRKLAEELDTELDPNKIDKKIDDLVRKYINTDTSTYPLVLILKFCFKEEFEKIWESPHRTLCFLIYKNKEKIENNFRILKKKWEEANKEVARSRGKILSRELRELEFLLRLDEEIFKRLLTVISLIGEIAGKVYDDLEETAKKVKSWKKLNVEEIKEVEDLSKEEKKISLTKFLTILGIFGTSLLAVLVIGWTVKKNFGFSNFFGQAEVKSIGNDTRSKGNNRRSIQQEIEKSKKITREKGGKFLGNKNVTTSNSTLNTMKSNNKTSIGKEENGTSKVHSKTGIQRDKTTDKRNSKGSNKDTKTGKKR